MMAEPAFSPEIEKALDAYAVPPVPAGLSDRLMARIVSGDNGVNVTAVALPASRMRRASPWRRTGRIIGIVGTFSLATATAAAAGVFGNPVYVPGVSEALVQAKIVEAPAPAIKHKGRMVAEPKAVTPAPAPPSATGSAAVVSRVTELRNDPEYAKLPPRERLKIAGKEVREMVRSGEASRQDVRAAVRELAQDADPATKEAWRKAAADRREKRIERREALRNATPDERAAMLQGLRERRQALQQDAEQ
jgi:polyhydroxyalkanoate synthesis regulator phasin